jgi:hypothetical protein
MSTMRRRPWLWWAIGGVCLVVAVMIFAGWVYGADPALQDDLDKTGSASSLVISPISLLITLAAFAIAVHQGRTPASLDAAAARLTCDARSQWLREAEFRQVRQPLPIGVRFSSTRRPVAAAREVVMADGIPGDWSLVPLDGDIADAVEVLRRLPRRQLVVLGDPGAGKSILALLMTLDLLEKPQSGEAIPVLLAINSWDPVKEGVDEFLIRRLREDHPFLATRAPGGGDLANALVTAGRVLPVLDGLDEMPAPVHTAALRRVEALSVARRPLILTSRGADYQRAVESSGVVLSLAAVVELAPVAPAEAAEFLRHPAPSRSRWQLVLDHLAVRPDGVLTQVFASPLAVALARTAYADPRTTPADLLSLPDRTAVTGALMRTFVSEVYGDHPKAGRWLSTLAYMLYRSGTRDLTWRLLSPSLVGRWNPRVWPTLLIALTVFFFTSIVLPQAAADPSSLFDAEPRLEPVAQLVRWAGALAVVIVFVCVVAAPHLSVRDRPVLWTVLVAGGVGVLAGAVSAVGFHLSAGGPNAIPWVPGSSLVGSLAFVVTLCVLLRHRVTQAVGRAVLATWGLLPWRLDRFLRWSHRVGVLRADGRVWQFRHVLLQDHLAREERLRNLAVHADLGDADAAELLAAMLAAQGEVDQLQARAEGGCDAAATRYAAFLAAADRVDQLRERADRGDTSARITLANLLLHREGETELRTRAEAGDHHATAAYAALLAGRGERAATVAFLRPRVDPPALEAARTLAELLAANGDLAGAITVMADRYPDDTLYIDLLGAVRDVAALRLVRENAEQAARILSRLGGLQDPRDEGKPPPPRSKFGLAIRVPHVHAAAPLFAQYLAAHGRVRDLTEWADGDYYGTGVAAAALAALLVDRGEFDELRKRARKGDVKAILAWYYSRGFTLSRRPHEKSSHWP